MSSRRTGHANASLKYKSPAKGRQSTSLSSLSVGSIDDAVADAWATKGQGRPPSVASTQSLDAFALSAGAPSPLTGEPPAKPTFSTKREFPSYVKHFIDDNGNFLDTIDLHAHHEETGVPITNAVVQEVTDLIPGITSLNINDCNLVTDVGLWALSRGSPATLQELRMRGLSQLTHVGIRAVSLQCKSLRVLDVSNCSCMDDLCIRVIAAGLWGLQDIRLAGLRITDTAVAELSSCCKEVTSLDMSRVPFVTDIGLAEVAKNCTKLTALDISNTKLITRGTGLEAIFLSCPNLTTVNIEGVKETPSRVMRLMATHCTNITDLNLHGCVKLTNDTLTELVEHLPHLCKLDIGACVRIKEKGIQAITMRGEALVELNLQGLPHMDVSACVALSRGATALKRLDLSECPNVTETAVKSIVTGMTRLTTLILNGCTNVRRDFMQHLVKKLPYVTNSKEYFGLAPLPDAEARIALTDLRRRQLRAVTDLQRIVRGYFDRKRVAAILRRRLEARCALSIQRIYRGFKARKHFQRVHRKLSEEEAAIIIQCMVRGWFGRVKARRARYRRKLLADQNFAATVIQSSYRALKGRRRYAKMLLRKFLRDQEERRLGVKKRRAARMLQGTWKTYLARMEAERIKEALLQARLLLMRKIAAAMHFQRIFRGHMARKLRRVLEAQMRLMIRQNRAAVIIQCAVRQRQAWLEARRRRWAREMAKRNKAATDIQRVFRGMKGRHLAAVMASLRALHHVEIAAAVRIQTKYRTYRARKFLLLLKMIQARKRYMNRMATVVQKMFRGMRGRQLFEVTLNMRTMRSLTSPLQDEIRQLEAEEEHIKREYKIVEGRITSTEEKIIMWEDERVKLLAWGRKEYDTDKLTGTVQRYETNFLREALFVQLKAFHVTLEKLKSQQVELAFKLHDVNRRLRSKRRELAPLEKNVLARTLEARRIRLKERKALEHKSAAILQGWARGLAVRRKLRLGLLPEPDTIVDYVPSGSVESLPPADGSQSWAVAYDTTTQQPQGYYDGYGYGGYGTDSFSAGGATSGDVEERELYPIHKKRGNVKLNWSAAATPSVPLRDLMLADEGAPDPEENELLEQLGASVGKRGVFDLPDDDRALSPVFDREDDEGNPVPPPRVPKILAHKIQLLDSEALKYRDRPGQMSLLRKHLKDNEWLLASGLADRIVNQQRTLRMKREKAVEARAHKNAALLKRNEEWRAHQEFIGMSLEDKESRKIEQKLAELKKQEEARKRAAHETWMAENQKLMEKEEHLSRRVEKVYRAWVHEQKMLRLVAFEKVARKREEKHFAAAARESSEWNVVWRHERHLLDEKNAAVAAFEKEFMADEEVSSAKVNVVWRRAVAIKEKQTRAAEEERRKREALLQAAADAKQRAVAIDAERQAIEEAERREQARLKAEEDARVAALKRMIAAQRAAQGYGATLSESDEDDGSECDSEKEEREAAEEAAWRQEMYDKLARDREEAEAKAVAEAEAKAAELEAAAAAKEDRDHQSVEGLYDGEVGRGRNGWVALADQDGYVYYFNDLTGATQWEKPEDY